MNSFLYFIKITLWYDFYLTITSLLPILNENHIIVLVEEIGATIKARRKLLGLTQPHLADLADVSINTLYKIERGQTNPTLEVLEKILEVLGMELELKIKKLN